MFSERLNDMMYHLCAASPGQLMDMGAWAKLDAQTCGDRQRLAEKAARARPAPLYLSDRLTNFDVYLAAKLERRKQLSFLVFGVLVEGADRYIAPLLDAVWAICEESDWGVHASVLAPREAETDEDALETACLLAWTHQLCGFEIERVCPEALLRVEAELSRRVLSPFMGREIAPWTRESGAGAKLVRVLAVFLMADTNHQRRWAGIRRALQALDDIARVFGPDGVHPGGLETWQADASALADAATLVMMATGGEVDVSCERAFLRLCDFPVSAHMGEGVFMNPDGDPEPKLCGETLFRIGERAAHAELKRLGAALNAKFPTRTDTGGMTARVIGTLIERAFRAEAAVFPVRKRVFLRQSARMLVGGAGFTCGLHGGSMSLAHMDAGNFEVCYKGRRVFGDLGMDFAGADAHSLPSVNGIYPLRAFGGVKDVSARFEDAFSCLSVNLAPGFPEASGVVAWQRTLMLSPIEGTVRLIEAFDLKEPAERVAFRFVTPCAPEMDMQGAYRIGGVRLSWEGDMASRVDTLPGGYAVCVYAPPRSMRGNYSFTLRPV